MTGAPELDVQRRDGAVGWFATAARDVGPRIATQAHGLPVERAREPDRSQRVAAGVLGHSVPEEPEGERLAEVAHACPAALPRLAEALGDDEPELPIPGARLERGGRIVVQDHLHERV